MNIFFNRYIFLISFEFVIEGAQQISSGKGHFYVENLNL